MSTGRMGLLETELDRLVKTALEELDAERVIVFGSLARAMTVEDEELGEWSDLDVVIIAETGLPFHERARRLLRRLRPRSGMDLFVYTPGEWEQMKAERAFARQEMLEKGRVVYERPRQ